MKNTKIAASTDRKVVLVLGPSDPKGFFMLLPSSRDIYSIVEASVEKEERRCSGSEKESTAPLLCCSSHTSRDDLIFSRDELVRHLFLLFMVDSRCDVVIGIVGAVVQSTRSASVAG